MFHWIITTFFSKSNSYIIVLMYKASDFFVCNLFFSADYIQNIHHYIIEKQKNKKMVFYGWINCIKNRDDK